MQILVHHDDLIQGGQSLDEFARERAEHHLGRFDRHVTSIHVFLADESGHTAVTRAVELSGEAFHDLELARQAEREARDTVATA